MIKNKLYIIVIFCITFLYAEENYLNIDAEHFEANQSNNILKFQDNVKMVENKNILLCQSLIINTTISKNSSKQIPKDYNATGDVSFTLYTQDNIFKVKGDTVLYYPLTKKYIIIGNGHLEDTKNHKKLTANKIYIDAITGHTKIDGDKDKPIKFRLKLSDLNK
ncbi:MAG: LptA/OstA family protein [Campylobacterota bacterium]|nr:LptA/OstA family protein [Campylobacterota bacterium]